MKIYLDNCCYARPFDDKSNEVVKFESDATLYIQQEIINGKLELVTSFMIHYENSQKPNEQQRIDIEKFFKNYRKIYVGIENIDELTELARKIMDTGIKRKDAYHIASAIFAKCDYFITVDKRLMNFKSDDIKIVNPIAFYKLWSEKND